MFTCLWLLQEYIRSKDGRSPLWVDALATKDDDYQLHKGFNIVWPMQRNIFLVLLLFTTNNAKFYDLQAPADTHNICSTLVCGGDLSRPWPSATWSDISAITYVRSIICTLGYVMHVFINCQKTTVIMSSFSSPITHWHTQSFPFSTLLILFHLKSARFFIPHSCLFYCGRNYLFK